MHAAAPVCFRHKDVAFGIDGKRVTMGKGARLMSRNAEAAQGFTSHSIENLYLFISAVGYVEEFLFAVR